MSHMVEQMAYVGEVPWHGLGVEVPAGISVDDLMVKAGLDWSISKTRIYLEGNPTPIKDKFALVRSSDGSVLDVVGPQYTPIQNREVMEFYREFCESGGMKMNTAGSLNKGKMVWALADIEADFALPGQDHIRGHLLFSSPNVSGKALTIMFTPIRVVCNNTIQMALREYGQSEGGYRQHHRKEFDPDEAKVVMGLARGMLADFADKAKFMASRTISDDQWDEFMKGLFPKNEDAQKEPRTWNEFRTARQNAPGTQMSEGTAWHAFNTVTFLADHVMGRSDDTRLNSAWYGSASRLKRKALDMAMKMAA